MSKISIALAFLSLVLTALTASFYAESKRLAEENTEFSKRIEIQQEMIESRDNRIEELLEATGVLIESKDTTQEKLHIANSLIDNSFARVKELELSLKQKSEEGVRLMEENTAFKALINPDGKPIFPKNLDELNFKFFQDKALEKGGEASIITTYTQPWPIKTSYRNHNGNWFNGEEHVTCSIDTEAQYGIEINDQSAPMVFDEEESKNDFGKTLVISIPYPKYLGYKEKGKPYYKVQRSKWFGSEQDVERLKRKARDSIGPNAIKFQRPFQDSTEVKKATQLVIKDLFLKYYEDIFSDIPPVRVEFVNSMAQEDI